MNPILRGVQLKIDRALEKFDALKKAVEPFRTGEAYELVRHPHQPMPDGSGHTALRFSLVAKKDIPVFLGVGIGEILHDLRSALDHIVYELARKHSDSIGTSFDGDSTQFPIFLNDTKTTLPNGKTLGGFSDKVKGQDGPKGLLSVHPDVRAHIKSLQPFSTGEGTNSPLWHLHELNNWDKHRTIYTTHLLKVSASVEATGAIGVMIGRNGPFQHDTFLGGVILAPRPGVPFDAWAHEVDVKFDFTAYVAFQQPTPCADRPVADVVAGIGKRVGDILEGIDKAFF